MTDLVKANCECSEEPVVAVKKGVFSNWGPFLWIFNIALVLITSGGWLVVIVGYALGKYLSGGLGYKCPKCGRTIDEQNYIL